MSILERYRLWYRHEKDSNQKMLAMLASVPEANRSDARFEQAINIANHLAICRENWLKFMDGKAHSADAWSHELSHIAGLPSRFAALEDLWTDYLARLDADQLASNFSFQESNGEVFHVPVEVQIVQLFGHASYHRGQIVLLVDQLGGETVDTDYVDWCWANRESL